MAIRNEKAELFILKVLCLTAIFSHNIIQSLTVKLQCNSI